ncbi:hypothetical protein F0562_019588 [Nyssa sinensis]|uniref:O-methyltransferase domain-containing protein n=1 Tax=Nyssa sinensis TaxID=561372 RepID=A0A5J5BU69_9ASTE|nr:hypothetical protein F0562_019588 [Nyssa sinensis]
MENKAGLDYLSVWGLGGLIATQMAIKAAIELNVFNIISDSGAEAQLSSAEIVSKIPTTNPNAAAVLDRILRVLGSRSLLSTSSRPCPNGEERTYGLSMESRALVTNTDGVCLAPVMLMASQRELVESLYLLKNMVIEPGYLPFQKAHGVNFFEYAAKDPKMGRMFDQSMACHSKMAFEMVFKVYTGFKQVKELMDVGGGNGTLLGRIVSTYPNVRGINFDLPHVIADAPNFPGVEHVAGDMFEPLPDAQTILLKSVLHDWDDDNCVKLLRNCWKALPANGMVIVIESAIPPVSDNDAELQTVILMDVAMMVVAGGKERSTAEFDNLAKAAGFAETRIFHIAQGIHVMEFVKKITE